MSTGSTGSAGRAARAAAQGAKLAVKYGPQAKIVWDKGGKQAATAAARRALVLNARRKALAHADGVKEGAVLKVAPEGAVVWVVLTGDLPIAAYPPSELPLARLLEHADLDKRVTPEEARARRGRRPRRPGRRSGPAGPRELG